MYDPLIFGKDQTERIVSIEPRDENCEVFYLDEEKNLHSTVIPNNYWVLCDKPIFEKSIRLEGELHYKWAGVFTTRESYIQFRYRNKKHDLYSIFNAKENHMVKTGRTYFKGLKTGDVSVLSFDIETTGLQPEASDALIVLISNTYRDRHGNKTRKLFSYDEYVSEKEMLEAWCEWVRSVDPDVLVGHNINCFDLNYMLYRAHVNGTTLQLGRDGSDLDRDNYESKFRIDQIQFREYRKSHIYGREICDTYFLASKYDSVYKKYDSLGLKKIIEAEGIIQEGRVFYDANRIRYDYKDKAKFELIKQYCVFDSDDALALYDLYIATYFYLTQNIPKSLQLICESATGSQINSLLVRGYLQDKHSIPKADEVYPFRGAISFGNAGIYRNVLKIDVKSEYPSIILQYEVYNREKDPKGYFLKMVEFFTIDRFKNKKLAKETGERYYSDIEQSRKVLINSSYGVCSTGGLNFNSPKDAEFITMKGRETIATALEWATGIAVNKWLEIKGEEDVTPIQNS